MGEQIGRQPWKPEIKRLLIVRSLAIPLAVLQLILPFVIDHFIDQTLWRWLSNLSLSFEMQQRLQLPESLQGCLQFSDSQRLSSSKILANGKEGEKLFQPSPLGPGFSREIWRRNRNVCIKFSVQKSSAVSAHV